MTTLLTSIYLPNLELLLFSDVSAFPNASRIGFAWISSIFESDRYVSNCFVASVLPAPDTPVTIMDWDFFEFFRSWIVDSATNFYTKLNTVLILFRNFFSYVLVDKSKDPMNSLIVWRI